MEERKDSDEFFFHVVLFSLIEDDFDMLMLETKWKWVLFNFYLNQRLVFDRTVFSMALLRTKEILTLLCYKDLDHLQELSLVCVMPIFQR